MLKFKGVIKSEGLDSPLRHYIFFIINILDKISLRSTLP